MHCQRTFGTEEKVEGPLQESHGTCARCMIIEDYKGVRKNPAIIIKSLMGRPDDQWEGKAPEIPAERQDEFNIYAGIAEKRRETTERMREGGMGKKK